MSEVIQRTYKKDYGDAYTLEYHIIWNEKTLQEAGLAHIDMTKKAFPFVILMFDDVFYCVPLEIFLTVTDAICNAVVQTVDNYKKLDKEISDNARNNTHI